MLRDRRLDDYIRALPSFSRLICIGLRQCIHEADPQIEEGWKWGPNFSRQGMVCGFGAFSGWVTLTFFKGALMKDEARLFNYGFHNAHNRSIKFKDVSEIHRQKIKKYVQEAVRLNLDRVKSPAPHHRRSTVELPLTYKKILNQKNLLEIFRMRPPHQKRDYVHWVTSPKRPETKVRRFAILLNDLRTGTYMKMPYIKKSNNI